MSIYNVAFQTKEFHYYGSIVIINLNGFFTVQHNNILLNNYPLK